MKLKKIIAGLILTIFFISQVSFIPAINFVYAEETQTSNEGKFHYDQLTESAKSIYNGIYNMYVTGVLKTGTQDYDLVENGYFTENQVREYQKGSTELTKAMSAARYAFYADYPEVFYVDFPKLTIRTTKGADGRYHIYIGSGRNENYYTEGFKNQEQVEKAITEFNTRVNEIVQGANNLEIAEGKNRQAEQIKYVHDEIINKTSYRLEDTCFPGNEGFLGTPYGILVKKQGVCEGYSRALKTVLDKLGINCILVQGAHQYSGEISVAHMWNYVQIEETTARQVAKKWYAVDTTQDDPEIYISEQRDINDYQLKFDSYGLDGFEGMKYFLAGQTIMNDRHFPNGVVEAAGDYEFEYPILEDESYGTSSVANADGLVVTYKPNAQVTEETTSAEFKVSYRGMGAAKSIEQGIYILARYHVYDAKTDTFNVSPWAYVLPDVYVLDDHDEYFCLYENQAMYMEFAATNIKPVKISDTDFEYLKYKGDGYSIIAKTDKIYNENTGYTPPPYVKQQTPTTAATFIVRDNPYHVKAVWDENLVLSEGVTEENIGYRIECKSAIGEAVTGDKYSKIENLTWNGTDTVEFDITFSKMFADDNVSYEIYVTGLVGENSQKVPNPVVCSVRNEIKTVCPMRNKGSWEIYGKPTLLESQDLSMNGWETSNGEKVSEKLEDRIALITSKTTEKQTQKMEELMQENFPDQEVLASSTYNLTLSLCKKMVVKTGQKVKVKVGFPEGYGPEDEGVTYKAYHFVRNVAGEVVDVEEIDCVVTQYGLIITCNAFSPFAVIATNADETAPKNRAVVATATEGGKITTENTDGTNIINLSEGESKTISIKSNEGYEIETITVCGETIEITNKENMNITVNYADVQNANNIVNANFVAKTVVEKEQTRNEEPVQPTATPAEITMPENVATGINKTVKITPTITETPGIQTYQWYKGETRLEGKTNKVLELKNITKEDAGEYILEVTSTIETSSVVTKSKPCTVVISSFDTTITNTTQKTLQPGDEFKITVNIDNFENIEDGILSITGQLEYDTNVLERIQIVEENNWDMEDGFNEANFKFAINGGDYVAEDSNIFSIVFKVKDTLTEDTQTTIKIKNIVGSNAIIDIPSSDAELNINIQKELVEDKITSDVYTIETDYISGISPETTVDTFKTNVDTTGTIVIKDKDGNILDSQAIITTGSTLQVGDTLQFTLVVTGDTNGNGEVDITDIAQLKLHIVEKRLLTDASLKAADVDRNGEITITDLAILKLVLLELKEL